ncbi:DUF2505 domain-containing protein [Rhodococcus spongiicola]|uniref:DUF2505 domain-containing protein n=1 Tax=Rhodococcus spongiicola TaxID=2487352 RepID=A0A438AS97_9NOCA|nr:DUF2505 domain-containing protein [Rhodococcus spongiicola]RVW01603.1 DUF2505 domain-containing protein [Rhodococcus spongiicola]
MARRIDHSAHYPHPVSTVHTALTDERYWRAWLQEVGGPGAKLDEVTVGDGTIDVAMTQSIPAEHLPSMVTKIRPGDLIITRTESWHALQGDHAEGTFSALVDGTPGRLRGTMSLTADADGSLLVMEGEVEVKLPIFGGKIESVIAEQVIELIEAENNFTARWTASI